MQSRRKKSKRLPRTLTVLATLTVVSILLGAGLLSWNLLSDGSPPPGPKAAAVVDQLSLTQPNPTFAQTASDLLEQAGYAVDYYSGQEVTVEFYRNLPTHGHDLLILRVHSGMARDYGEPTGYVSLFSGEPYSETKYAAEEAAGLLGRARYYDGSPEYFGIVPAFIQSTMEGRFEGTTIIMMGCDGLMTGTTAEAFVQRGANAVVGWSGPVSAAHTDKATERLLQHILLDGTSVQEAVTQTMAEVGPDPDFDTTLLVYPS